MLYTELSFEEFDDLYKPLKFNDYTCELFFETKEEAINKALEYSQKHNTKEYQHIWTAIDGEKSNIDILNGWHLVNKMYYVVTEEPWGDGTDTDSNIQIYVSEDNK